MVDVWSGEDQFGKLDVFMHQALLIEALNDDLIAHAMGNDMDLFQTRVLDRGILSSSLKQLSRRHGNLAVVIVVDHAALGRPKNAIGSRV